MSCLPVSKPFSHLQCPLPHRPLLLSSGLQSPLALRAPLHSGVQNRRPVPFPGLWSAPISRAPAWPRPLHRGRGGLSVSHRASSTCTWTHPLPIPSMGAPPLPWRPPSGPQLLGGPGPTASGRLGLWRLLGHPGLERTSGRRTRPPSLAHSRLGIVVRRNGVVRLSGKPEKWACPASQHATRLSFSSRKVRSPNAFWEPWVNVSWQDYNSRNAGQPARQGLHSRKCSSDSLPSPSHRPPNKARRTYWE